MKHLYTLVVACALAAIHLQAQVNVNASIGSSAGYTTLKAAFDAINAGTHQGVITITLSGSTTETATASLSKSGTGSANYTSILIYPTTAATITGNLASPLLTVSGAQNVTIDGRVNQSGSTRTLVLQNISTSAAASTIRFANDAANCTLQYTNIEGSSRSLSNATVTFVSSSGTAGIQNISIQNNDIRPAGSNLPYQAFYSNGYSSVAVNRNNTFSGNQVHDYFLATGAYIGLRLNGNNSAWTISNNSFYQSAARTTTNNGSTHYVIYIASGDGYTISGNYIGGSAPLAAGSPLTIGGNFNNTIYGMYLALANVNVNNIDGNVITNISQTYQYTAQASSFYGIYANSGKFNIGTGSGNTIGAAAGNGLITTTITNTATTFWIGVFSANAQLNIQNNTFGGITINSSSAGNIIGRCIETDYASTLTIQNNQFGGNTTGSFQVNASNPYLQGIISFSNVSGTTYSITGNTFKNLLLSNATGTGNITAVYHIASAVNVVAATTISNNSFSNFSATAATGDVSITGVNLNNGSYAGASIDGTISNNQFNNLSINAAAGTASGISAMALTGGSANNLAVTNNTINTLSAVSGFGLASGNVIGGIELVSPVTGTLTITGNTIYDLENTGSTSATRVSGITTRYAGTNAIIAKNKIYNLRNPNIDGNIVAGIILNGNSGSGTFTVANNMISFNPANASAYGIVSDTIAASVKLYYNSIYLGGTAAGSSTSAAFFRNGATNTTAFDIRNNIFYSVRTGGTDNYGIINNAVAPLTGWAADYNLVKTSNSTSVALWNGLSLDLAALTTATGVANIRTGTINFASTANGDLHLSGVSNGDNLLAGLPVSVTDDFDGSTRSSYRVYFGADEALLTLPINIVYFTGNRVGTANKLSWKTECTDDNNDFIIERSGNGRSFTPIGHISLDRIACGQAQMFTDNAPLSGHNYYRLRMQDATGKISYSQIVLLLGQDNGFEVAGIYPTLVTQNSITLNISSAKNRSITIILTDMQGRTVLATTQQVYEGAGTFTLDLHKYAAGHYQVTITTGDGYVKTEKIVKQ